MANRTCSIDGCGRKHYGRDFCHMHYKRWERWGDPMVVAQIKNDDHARFWSKVAVTPSCWLWTPRLDRDGYGHIQIGQHMKRAHRVAYEWIAGAIPEGLTLDHLCSVRHCVNPAHLEPVTAEENVRRAAVKHLDLRGAVVA